METFLTVGTWLFITVIMVSLLPQDGEIKHYVFFVFVLVGAAMGFIKQDFHTIFVWIIEPVGCFAWIMALICLANAHHNGCNIWLALFLKGSIRNWR